MAKGIQFRQNQQQGSQIPSVKLMFCMQQLIMQTLHAYAKDGDYGG